MTKIKIIGAVKPLNWTQNVENIFTQKELDDLVKSHHLEMVEKNGIIHYIKYKCSKEFYKN